MTIDVLRSLCDDKDNIHMTFHVSERCRKRNITSKSIIHSILNGEIIEDYPNDYPFPSALVLGCDTEDKKLHVVAGVGDDILWIVTAYYPDENWWESDFKTRKGRDK